MNDELRLGWIEMDKGETGINWVPVKYVGEILCKDSAVFSGFFNVVLRIIKKNDMMQAQISVTSLCLMRRNIKQKWTICVCQQTHPYFKARECWVAFADHSENEDNAKYGLQRLFNWPLLKCNKSSQNTQEDSMFVQTIVRERSNSKEMWTCILDGRLWTALQKQTRLAGSKKGN